VKKVFVLMLILGFIFGSASRSFAGNEFQIKGIVVKAVDNRITIKDDKGKETVIDGSLNDIKVGDSVLVKMQIFKIEHLRTELTEQDMEFLTKQCLIEQADVIIIPALKASAKLVSLIDKRDCRLLAPYKASRAYYKNLNLKSAIPLPPAGWDVGYLTNDEFKNYLYILDNAPW
jgi:hypothetical protein